MSNEDNLSIALGQLTGETLKWWDRDEYRRWYHKKHRINTWENLKWNMCEKYSPQSLSPQSRATHLLRETIQGDKMPKLEPKENLNQIGNQSKSFVPKTFLELTCYRCKVKGHVAKFCPTRGGATKTEPDQQTMCRDPQAIVESPTDPLNVSVNATFLIIDKNIELVKSLLKTVVGGGGDY